MTVDLGEQGTADEQYADAVDLARGLFEVISWRGAVGQFSGHSAIADRPLDWFLHRREDGAWDHFIENRRAELVGVEWGGK